MFIFGMKEDENRTKLNESVGKVHFTLEVIVLAGEISVSFKFVSEKKRRILAGLVRPWPEY